VALSEVAEDSIDALVLSASVVDALYFFLSIPVLLSCSSYGSYIEKECESPSAAAIDPYAAFDLSVPSPEADMCPGI
jgi:hypothetical protein